MGTVSSILGYPDKRINVPKTAKKYAEDKRQESASWRLGWALNKFSDSANEPVWTAAARTYVCCGQLLFPREGISFSAWWRNLRGARDELS